jgi:hypothetical protein
LLAIAQCRIDKTNFFHADDTKRSSMPNQEVVCRSGFLWLVIPIVFSLMHGRLVQAALA